MTDALRNALWQEFGIALALPCSESYKPLGTLRVTKRVSGQAFVLPWGTTPLAAFEYDPARVPTCSVDLREQAIEVMVQDSKDALTNVLTPYMIDCGASAALQGGTKLNLIWRSVGVDALALESFLKNYAQPAQAWDSMTKESRVLFGNRCCCIITHVYYAKKVEATSYRVGQGSLSADVPAAGVRAAASASHASAGGVAIEALNSESWLPLGFKFVEVSWISRKNEWKINYYPNRVPKTRAGKQQQERQSGEPEPFSEKPPNFPLSP